MLELRMFCENCAKSLPSDSKEAMICSFECTYCKKCVEEVLNNVCPNCTGGFEKRPIRPSHQLVKYPASTKKVVKVLDDKKFQQMLKQWKYIDPSTR